VKTTEVFTAAGYSKVILKVSDLPKFQQEGIVLNAVRAEFRGDMRGIASLYWFNRVGMPTRGK
jgi:hypothetical protein